MSKLLIILLILGILILGVGFFYFKYLPRNEINQNSLVVNNPAADKFISKKFGFAFVLPNFLEVKSDNEWESRNNEHFLALNPKEDTQTVLYKSGNRLKTVNIEVTELTSIEEYKSVSLFSVSHSYLETTQSKLNGNNILHYIASTLGQTGPVNEDRISGFLLELNGNVINISTNNSLNDQSEADDFIQDIYQTLEIIENR